MDANTSNGYITYDMVALIPDDFKDTQGLIYSRDWMVEGTFVLKPSDDDGNING